MAQMLKVWRAIFQPFLLVGVYNEQIEYSNYSVMKS